MSCSSALPFSPSDAICSSTGARENSFIPALMPDGDSPLDVNRSCQPGQRVCVVLLEVSPFSAPSVLSHLSVDNPPFALQMGIAETGLQRAILRRVQEILAVAKTIPGTSSSFLPAP